MFRCARRRIGSEPTIARKIATEPLRLCKTTEKAKSGRFQRFHEKTETQRVVNTANTVLYIDVVGENRSNSVEKSESEITNTPIGIGQDRDETYAVGAVLRILARLETLVPFDVERFKLLNSAR
jgi:hypothetical protein